MKFVLNQGQFSELISKLLQEGFINSTSRSSFLNRPRSSSFWSIGHFFVFLLQNFVAWGHHNKFDSTNYNQSLEIKCMSPSNKNLNCNQKWSKRDDIFGNFKWSTFFLNISWNRENEFRSSYKIKKSIDKIEKKIVPRCWAPIKIYIRIVIIRIAAIWNSF